MARLYEIEFTPGAESAEADGYALVRVWTEADAAEATARHIARHAMTEESYEDWVMGRSRLVVLTSAPAPTEFLSIEWR